MKTTVLIEALDLTEAKIDIENRTVRQTLIRAGKSLNKRQYSEAVLSAATPLFEGTKAFSDHPSKSEMKDRSERSIRHISGWFTEATFENGALIATRHFTNNEAGRDSWALVEQIVTGKAPPSLMGASINALGRGRVEKIDNEDVLIVESIDQVISCDDVTTPAAAGGWERLVASAGSDLTTELLKAVDYEEWQECQPSYVERLKKEWKTVRLEDETKRVLAEADSNVKAANTKAAETEQALSEAQINIQALNEANTKLLSELEIVRRELTLEKALSKVKLPELYLEDLRSRLPQVAMAEWQGLIEIEIAKARKAKAPVTVTGAGAQINNPLPVSPIPIPDSTDMLPREFEDVDAWARRVGIRKP